MTDKDPSSGLHIPSLRIQGLFGLSDLSIDRLGHATLISGKNGVGKTTVLEALSVFADRGGLATLTDILYRRNELEDVADEDGDTISVPRWESLFYNRQSNGGATITVGSSDAPSELRITLREAHQEEMDPNLVRRLAMPTDEIRVLSATYNSGEEDATPLIPGFIGSLRRPRRFRLSGPPTRKTRSRAMPCNWSGPGTPSNTELNALWDSIALTDTQQWVLDTMTLLQDDDTEIEGIATISSPEDTFSPTYVEPRMIFRRKGESDRLPLRSLGDGASRMLATALALAESRNGLLLIDEAENGLHYSVQQQFWDKMMRAAHENSVQIVATTHSWDTVVGFARAAAEIEEIDGRLIRIERDDRGVYSVEYDEHELSVIAERGIEVR